MHVHAAPLATGAALPTWSSVFRLTVSSRRQYRRSQDADYHKTQTSQRTITAATHDAPNTVNIPQTYLLALPERFCLARLRVLHSGFVEGLICLGCVGALAFSDSRSVDRYSKRGTQLHNCLQLLRQQAGRQAFTYGLGNTPHLCNTASPVA